MRGHLRGWARVSTATSELESRGKVGNRGSCCQLGCSEAWDRGVVGAGARAI